MVSHFSYWSVVCCVSHIITLHSWAWRSPNTRASSRAAEWGASICRIWSRHDPGIAWDIFIECTAVFKMTVMCWYLRGKCKSREQTQRYFFNFWNLNNLIFATMNPSEYNYKDNTVTIISFHQILWSPWSLQDLGRYLPDSLASLAAYSQPTNKQINKQIKVTEAHKCHTCFFIFFRSLASRALSCSSLRCRSSLSSQSICMSITPYCYA